MKAEDYYLISATTTSIAAVFAFVFGIWQIKINERLKKLQDFVAISISPNMKPHGIVIMNVGKLNLYLKKAEIGSLVHDYAKPRLISIGKDPFYRINFSLQNMLSNLNQEIPVKLYFIDETEQKYLSTGSVIIEGEITPPSVQPNVQGVIPQGGETVAPQATPPPAISISQSFNIREIRAWSYKMEKYNWRI